MFPSMLTDNKIIEIYCIANDFCKEFSRKIKKLKKLPEDGKKHCNRSCEMSDSEIMTIDIDRITDFEILVIE